MFPSLVLASIETADWLHLSDGEQIQWTGRPSVYTIALSIATGFILAVLGITLSLWLLPRADASALPRWLGYLPLALTAVGFGRAAVTYLHWIRLRYVITDDQVYVKYGLISRDVTQIRLDRVQNTSYEQSILERVLSFGDVRLYTAGTDAEDITLSNVPDPEVVKRIVTSHLSDQTEADR
ncbi:PH domain-containing protein [Halovenus sp. HT40]|uniref:PH domain-containing protein n=1 Tax=Halovenus sp. HT40 TaxID=3126691 RepID=UPI00300EB594